jgi:LysM repeat protein
MDNGYRKHLPGNNNPSTLTKIKGFFKNVFNPGTSAVPAQGQYDPYAQSAPGAQVGPSLPTPGFAQSYQVKAGDTFESIAKQHGISTPQLQDTNNMLVPPPKGHYITVKPPTVAPIPQNATAYAHGPQVAPAYGPPKPTTPSIGGGGYFSLGEVQKNIQSQIAAGKPPTNVPNDLLASLGATPQSMAANGYVQNPNTLSWTLPGGDTGAPDPYSEVRSVYWSKSKGYITPEIANLKAKKRRQRQGNRPATATEATNAGAAPTTTLDVRVGSG